MNEDLKVNASLTIPGWELWYSVGTSGGPGGQHANKTSTRVTLHWVPSSSSALSNYTKERVLRRLRSRLTQAGEVQIVSDATRSQLRNREDARARLAELIADALVQQKRRKKTRPTRGSVERRIRAKKQRSGTKALRRTPTSDS